MGPLHEFLLADVNQESDASLALELRASCQC